MPKVTVMSLPEESIQMLTLPKTAEQNKLNHGMVWRNVVGKVQGILGNLSLSVVMVSALAFLLSRVVIMGEMSPFGLAFFAATAPYLGRKALLCGGAAMLGLVSTGQFLECGVYFFSIFAYLRLADKLTKVHNKLLAMPLLMFCSVAVSGMVMMIAIWEQATLYTAVLIMFDAAICMISAYLFTYSVPILVAGQDSKEHGITNESIICVMLLFAIAVSGLNGIRLFSASACSIVGSILVLSAAFCASMGSGGAVGTIIGLTIGLSSGQVFAVALYALSGVLAGSFRTLGKYAVVLGYFLGNIIIVLYFGRAEAAMQYICEASLASVIFLLIPKKSFVIWREQFLDSGGGAGDEQVKQAVQKLQKISSLFSDLGGANAHFSEDAKIRLHEEEIARALSQVGEKVCQECTKRSICWEDNFYNTSQAMMDMLELAEKNRLNSHVLPRYFNENCTKKTELMGTIKLVVEYNQTQGYWQKKMLKQRQLVSEQIKAIATIVKNLACEINKDPAVNKPMAVKIKEKAASLDCLLDNVLIQGKSGTTTVKITKQPCNHRRECVNTLLPLAAGLLREKMVVKSKCGCPGQKPCKITMHAAKNFSIITGIASAAKQEEAVNGDNCAVLPLSGGKAALLLSDGMGSGPQAAGESNTAIKFLRKMLETGFAVDVAVQTVNAMLLLKSPEEKFATLDMLIVDLYSAEGEFLKIGAAPSYVKRVREVGILKRNSLPIGILNNIEIDPIKVQFAPGDIIVMVSDGIVDAPPISVDKDLWLCNILRCLPECHPQDIADRILAEAQKASGGKGQDDMTVLCIKVEQKYN
ncbi:MAG: stage II sporulation protein E [Pelosinus sp.]|nr:stage II sporulation protein E [Pelosinus sp.]